MKKQNIKSPILVCKNVSKKFDQLEILKNIKFSLFVGEKIGLIGSNGSGKTTLFKIIVGEVERDEGTIEIKKNTKIEYLPQFHITDLKLSPGQLAKKVLHKLVYSDADVFLLDEPTNNLDIEGLSMIENFVKESNKSFIIISHDREFLDQTVGKIIELDIRTRSNSIYDGNYTKYAKEHKLKVERQWNEYEDKTEKIGKLDKTVKDRLSWMKEIETNRKNNKRLSPKEKEKPAAAILRDKEGRAGRRARLIKDRLDKYKEESSIISRPEHVLLPRIDFETLRGSDKVFYFKEIEKSIGKLHIGPINFQIQYGDRVHIEGGNGSGKTTLIKLMMRQSEPDKGVIEKGKNVRIGYIPQERWNEKSSQRVIDDFIQNTHIEEGNSRKILNRFRLTTEDIKKEINQLSPGEYSRLIISELVAQKPNCIILDEPTNHLDLEISEEIEKGLQKFSGTLIVVSHDRYFIDKIKINRVLNLSR